MATKKCTKCGEIKPLSEYHFRHNTRDKRVSHCKLCANAAHKLWVAANAASISEYQRAYDKGRANDKREYSKTRRRENALASDRWRKKNPVKSLVSTALRLARVRVAQPPWADIDKMRTVYWRARTWNMHVDHIVPLKSNLVCGLHVWENLQLLSPVENLKKKNSHWPDMPE